MSVLSHWSHSEQSQKKFGFEGDLFEKKKEKKKIPKSGRFHVYYVAPILLVTKFSVQRFM